MKFLKEITKFLIITLTVGFIVISFAAETVIIEGESMYPTLHNGDRIIIDKLSYRLIDPKIGDIVVTKYPADPRIRLIKRVMGKAGDRVKIQNSVLYVNDNPIQETYINEELMEDFNEVLVPPNTIFLLGDNRNHSEDSRSVEVGFVSLKLLSGKAFLRVYPFDNIERIE